MTNPRQTEDLDDILSAFHQACDRPTQDQIDEWTRRYPKFADDICEYAVLLIEWSDRQRPSDDEPDELMLARGRSVALNALHDAEVAALARQPGEEAETFQEFLSTQNKSVPQLAREWDIARGVLADLMSGRMRPPVGERLVSAFVSRFNKTRDAFDRALQLALAAPSFGHAKADQTPTVVPRTYEEIIRTSGMSAERRRYWLGED